MKNHESKREDEPEDSVQWNNDPDWIEYCQTFDSVIKAIAAKRTTDPHLQQDCAQDARIALLSVCPEQVDAYEDYQNGDIAEEDWQSNLDAYCRQVIHFTVLSTLNSMKTGNWYVGRTRRRIDPGTGDRVKVHVPARYSSLDQLMQESGLQIDEEGEVSWDRVSQDGIDTEE